MANVKAGEGNTLLTTSYCEGSVFHRPNRAAMIAERIEGGMQGGERAHSPSAEHIVGHEAFGGPAHQGVVDNSAGDAVSRVRSDRGDLALL